MDIIKFSEYLLESVELPILDVVIGSDGTIYNGSEGTKLIKGRIEREKGIIKSIIGPNNEYYPAGIDKNGNLVAVEFKDGKAQTFVNDELPFNRDNIDSVNLTDAQKKTKDIPMPQQLIKKYKRGWVDNVDVDYYDLVPITPTGWVNVKVDMEIVKRVRRYAKGIGTHIGYGSFLSKLDEFQRVSELEVIENKKGAKKKRRTIQAEMSVIIMLHYINEIKDFFTPSSSGFLFESFLAGLIPNARVKEDNTAADIVADGEDGKKAKYQIKLISSETTYVDLVKEEEWEPIEGKKEKKLISSEYLDYYVICLKYVGKIDVYIIKGEEFDKPINRKYTTPGKVYKMVKYTTPKGFVKHKRVVSEHRKPKLILSEIIKNVEYIKPKDEDNKKVDKSKNPMVMFSIDLTRIESRIEAIGKDLKSSLDSLYEEISKFQYNVETLVTGTRSDGSIVKEQSEFEKYYKDGLNNIDLIKTELENLKNSIGK